MKVPLTCNGTVGVRLLQWPAAVISAVSVIGCLRDIVSPHGTVKRDLSVTHTERESVRERED